MRIEQSNHAHLRIIARRWEKQLLHVGSVLNTRFASSLLNEIISRTRVGLYGITFKLLMSKSVYRTNASASGSASGQ